jgi:predicted Zn-dependent protease
MDLLRPIERREMIEDNAENLRKSFPQAILREILYREVRTSRSFASYRGVSVNETASLFEARATALDPGDGAAFSEEVRSRVFANLVSLPFGTELGKRMARLQVADRLPEGKSLVFIPPRVVADLMNALAPAFVASEVHGGRSFVRDFLGKSLGAPRLHVIDDPGIPGALYTRAFDDRGIPPSPVVLLREGRAFGLYYDLETARRQDTTPTGHGVGERAEPSNIIVRSGTRSRNAIGMDLGDYLVLDGLLSPSPLDLERGTLDSICDVLVFRKNTFCGSARHLRLRTPLTKLLLGIREIADDQTRLGNVDACSLLVEGLEFTPL